MFSSAGAAFFYILTLIRTPTNYKTRKSISKRYFKNISNLVHKLASDWIKIIEKYQTMRKTEEDKYAEHEEEMRIQYKLELDQESYELLVKDIAKFYFYYKV